MSKGEAVGGTKKSGVEPYPLDDRVLEKLGVRTDRLKNLEAKREENVKRIEEERAQRANERKEIDRKREMNIRKKEAERIRRQQREKEEQLKKERQQLALEQARERNLSQRHAKFVRLRAKIELYRRADETADQSKKKHDIFSLFASIDRSEKLMISEPLERGPYDVLREKQEMIKQFEDALSKLKAEEQFISTGIQDGDSPSKDRSETSGVDSSRRDESDMSTRSTRSKKGAKKKAKKNRPQSKDSRKRESGAESEGESGAEDLTSASEKSIARDSKGPTKKPAKTSKSDSQAAASAQPKNASNVSQKGAAKEPAAPTAPAPMPKPTASSGTSTAPAADKSGAPAIKKAERPSANNAVVQSVKDEDLKLQKSVSFSDEHDVEDGKAEAGADARLSEESSLKNETRLHQHNHDSFERAQAVRDHDPSGGLAGGFVGDPQQGGYSANSGFNAIDVERWAERVPQGMHDVLYERVNAAEGGGPIPHRAGGAGRGRGGPKRAPYQGSPYAVPPLPAPPESRFKGKGRGGAVPGNESTDPLLPLIPSPTDAYQPGAPAPPPVSGAPRAAPGRPSQGPVSARSTAAPEFGTSSSGAQTTRAMKSVYGTKGSKMMSSHDGSYLPRYHRHSQFV
eukprot:CAMPEP_0113909700 /NCGR_PEP_ID=MMETSP0780_2-20120614/27032_1 /TAXON_ID=652834 /ORGANISM="Palpitomonas bilix" /LENGTH=626 /DNA_ID=CAMNT_0000905607 /DNA_START=510 /DNA_END=2390 /DNA_ORIENTATION=+ /assembly_acc=CAM_ASM_000599